MACSSQRCEERQLLDARCCFSGIRKLLPRVASTLPPELKITPLSDQSVFVRGAVQGVIREAVIAAMLTAIMILLFLGSWRSTIIIAISIPLSILTSVMVLSFLGETINTMTLGGLALAVGILVDDATVTIENIERFLEEGQPLRHCDSWKAPRRFQCRRLCRRFASASSFFRCSSLAVWRASSSFR